MGGEPKRRGTFEERRSQAIARKEAEELARIQARQEAREAEEAKVAAMTEAERDDYYARQERAPSAIRLLAAATMFAGGFSEPPPRLRTLKGRRRY